MRLRSKIAKCASAVALTCAIACSERAYRLGSNDFAESGVRPDGPGGAAGGPGGAAGGPTGLGGSGGTIDASRPEVGCDSGDAGWCAELTLTPTGSWARDVILVVDGSSSMAAEMAEVQAALNGFAARIATYPIDSRIFLIAQSAFPNPGICVPPPLGSGNCPPEGSDTALPRLFHHHRAVLNDQNDLLAVITSVAPELAQHRNPYAGTSLVIVSDGDGPPIRLESLAAVFQLEGWMPVYALYAFTQCPSARAEGRAYRELVDRTTGVHSDLCTEPVAAGLDRVATNILAAAAPSCVHSLPLPPGSDADKVNLELTLNQARRPLSALTSAAECDSVRDGWYPYARSTPAEENAIVLCPATCERLRHDPSHQIHLMVACLPVTPPC